MITAYICSKKYQNIAIGFCLVFISSLLVFFSVFSGIYAEAAANDSSISLKKDPGSGLFTLTVRDPDGIQEFSLTPAGKLPYGGGLSGCKPSFVSTNVSFADPTDFTPVMSGSVIDCNNNTTELEISRPVDGLAKSIALKKEAPPPPPPPTEEAVFEEIEVKERGPLSAEDIRYPVPELSSCGSETECRSYCDNAQNAKECFAFAKKYNLISEEESKEAADEFLNVRNGPGGCNSGASCEEYCSSIDRLDECISFAEETGYYSPEELAEARKFQELVKSGASFPGGCTERNSCEVYCTDASHMEECLDFAETSGFMPQDEIDEARKFMTLMQQGESPGGCNSKEQCENFCSEDANIEECIAFAEKAGVMTSEEAEMARKVGGKGPGGCHSKKQCEAYCEANSEECFNFAQEHGLISESDLEEMREGMEQFRENLDKMPPEAVQCLRDVLGEENFNKITNGEPIFDRSMEGKMKSCFGEITAQFSKQLGNLPPEAAECIKDALGEEGFEKLQRGEQDEDLDFRSLETCFQQLQASFGGGGNFGAGGFSGPGGCSNTEECSAYCQENPEECQGFGPPGGGGFVGPGGCSSAEDCTAYCQENFEDEECAAFIGGGGGGFPGGPGGGGGGFVGPGGCTGVEDCTAYCQENSEDEECAAFIGGGGGFPGGPGGGTGGSPGGCQGVEECTSYCTEHYTDPACAAYIGGGGGGGLSQSCIKPPGGIVGWWSADLVFGTSVPDITKNNNGTIAGGVTTVPMEVGDAFQFDGSSGHISIGNQANLNFGTGPFSLEAWFNWNGGGGTAANNIIRKSNYGPGAGSGYWLRTGAGKLEFSVGATTQAEGQSIVVAPISTGTWHHAVGVKEDSGEVKLYVDGESAGTLLRQSAVSESTSDFPFTIGAWEGYPGGPREFWNGEIDEVAVYNRALSASDARALFDAGSVGKCATSFGRTNRELPQASQQQSQGQGVACPEMISIAQCPSGQERFVTYESPECGTFYGCRGREPQVPQDNSPYLPEAFDVTPEICAPFKGVPACSYVGAPDSQNYKLCTQCSLKGLTPTSSRGENNFFANILGAFYSESR